MTAEDCLRRPKPDGRLGMNTSLMNQRIAALAGGCALILALLLLLLASAPALGPVQAADARPISITILHMNDPHGYYDVEKRKDAEPAGGFAKAAGLIEKIRKSNRAEDRTTLLLIAGDLLTGTPFTRVWEGKMGVDLMNRMEFDVMVIGNHEFDAGTEHLVSKLKPAANFPFISANILDSEGKRLFEPFITRPLGDRGRVVIVGLTTEETPHSTYPPNVKGLSFPDPIETFKELSGEFTDEDFVIALTHLGVKRDTELARACPVIDVIVGGHSHTALHSPLIVGDTLIVQAGAYSEYLGRLDLEIIDGRVTDHSGKLIRLSADVKADPAIASVIDGYKSKLDDRLSRPIGETEVALKGNWQAVRSGEQTNLGRLVACAMARRGETQAALLNGGSIRAGIDQGKITLAELYTALPFPNTLVTMRLKGSDLAAVVRRSDDLPYGSGGKLQVCGLKLGKADGKTIIREVDGVPFKPDQLYTVAVNNFMAAGGDGYTLLKEKGVDMVDTRLPITDVVSDFIERKGVVTSRLLETLQ